MASEPSDDRADPACGEFTRRYEGHPVLADDGIYALPRNCTKALERNGVLTSDEAQFERDLAKAAGSGFFLGRRFVYLPGCTDLVDSQPAPDPELNEATENIRNMLVEECEAAGRTKTHAESLVAQLSSPSPGIARRRCAFAGWLITQEEFRHSRDSFRQRWQKEIEEQRAFPHLPRSFVGEGPSIPDEERPFYNDYMLFYTHWCIERLQTWDLPVPMDPQLPQPNFYHLPSVAEAGVTLFLPWFLLRDKDLRVEELIGSRQDMFAPRDLQSWIDREPKNMSYKFYADLLEVYFIIELCLKRRYSERIRGRGMVGKIDLSIAQMYEGVGDQALKRVDTIERVRRFMQKCFAEN